MKKEYYFPFGQKLRKVEQEDKNPKDAFVLGVYASAVHATWIDEKGKQLIPALAVASEPEIFWRGENAEEIIKFITIPEKLGKLIPARNKNLNGPSAKALDDLYLTPLGLNRQNTWLCDLLPESRMNMKQKNAIEKHYNKFVSLNRVPPVTIPVFDKKELNSESRRKEIYKELKASKANTIILLGDEPIKYFLKSKEFKKLSDFGDTDEEYGQEHEIEIEGNAFTVIPLCHPRNAGKFGAHSPKWHDRHMKWVDNKTKNL